MMSLIHDVFYKYERVARVYPALIVGSPALLAAALTMPTLPSHTITGNAVTVAVWLAFLYALTHLVRSRLHELVGPVHDVHLPAQLHQRQFARFLVEFAAHFLQIRLK